MRQQNIPLFKLIWPFCIGFLLMTVVGILALDLMMGIRSFSAGENLWAKNQKAATFQILRYLHTQDPQSAEAYQEAFKVHRHFMTMREIVTNKPDDTERIRENLVAIGMQPADIGYAIWIQRYFGRTPPLQKMFAAWEKADANMLQLERIYQEITAYHQQPHDPQELARLAAEVFQADYILRTPADSLSNRLGVAAHQVYNLLIYLEIFLFLSLLSGIIWRTHRFLRDRQAIADALAVERQRAEITLAAIGDAVISIDEQGQVKYMNEAAHQLCSCPPLEQEASLPEIRDLVYLIDETTGIAVPFPLQELLENGQNQAKNENAHCLLRRDGSTVSVSWVASLIRDDQAQIQGAVLVMHDTTREKQMIERLSWLAQHDPLTSLYNRRAFEEHLTKAIDDLRVHDLERRDNAGHVLIFVDLDQFKVVNDTSGHAAGDELLCLIGDQIAHALRSVDILARMGGDEFAILLTHCSLEHGKQRAEEIRQLISQAELSKGARKFTTTASIGLVHLNNPGETPADALSAADLACYKAKDNGRNRIEIYHKKDVELTARYGEMTWVEKIHTALRENHFLLYAQPVVPFNPQLPPHFELLLRLRDENGNIASPGMFIPAAERFGLMPLIDRWVIRQAFAHISQLNARDPANRQHVFAINLSGATFCDKVFADEVRAIFAANDVDYAQICFEITETHAVINLPQAISFIKQMRTLGCAFALDDFGAGMSSFGYLKHLPVDYLKIDGNLVKGICGSLIDKAMVEMINHLGHAMQTRTIGEYAENNEIVDALRQCGVDFAQGYALGYPSPWPPQA